LRLFLICLGGAIGSGARYLVALAAAPSGTLVVNLSGCLLMGFVMYASAFTRMSEEVRLMLTAGILGGFTTYSAFNHETTILIRNGAFGHAALNVAATLIGCFIAGLIGFALARIVFGR
jgi:CrcB protein